MEQPFGGIDFIVRIACLVPSMTPSRLTLISLRQSSSVSSSGGLPRPMPALLTSTSSRPKRSMVAATTFSHAPSSATSCWR